MRLVAERRRAESARETNKIVIFSVSSQITFKCKRLWTLTAFIHFFKLYKVNSTIKNKYD